MQLFDRRPLSVSNINKPNELPVNSGEPANVGRQTKLVRFGTIELSVYL
jgi:hypothetical protein